MDIRTRFGQAVVQLRKERGISQYDLAKSAEVTFRYLSDVENGKRNVSMQIIEKIAAALNVLPSQIMEVAESLPE